MFDRFHKTTSGLDPDFVRPLSWARSLWRCSTRRCLWCRRRITAWCRISRGWWRMLMERAYIFASNTTLVLVLTNFISSNAVSVLYLYSSSAHPGLPSRLCRFWVSDEYGPYIYRFSAGGDLIQTIQPVDALLPRDANGNLNFTSEANPTTGRAPNQGIPLLV